MILDTALIRARKVYIYYIFFQFKAYYLNVYVRP
ncbi:unnamed protein product [Paramecium sonneborni]|uniref:Uncharacterized protein n=1 Tax=Paramecium sonneborni TaxID=65129 RepID=A0A8S1RU91_9CILI|nr:unnamed protein product [Paramecium sonneborni]